MTKALTLTQPWATLVAEGTKLVETRSWSTRYRGPILIHAAKGWTRFDMRFAVDLHRAGILRAEPRELPHGAIVARAVLDDVRTAAWSVEVIDRQEAELGDYSGGRFAWWLRDIRPVDPPIEWRGALGLWEGPELVG